MDKLDEIKENLLKMGFKKDGENGFVYESVSYNTMNINGRVVKQEKKNVLKLEYTCVGGNMEDSDVCLNDIYYFDIFQDGEQVITVGVYDFKELAEIFGVNEKNKV